MAIKTINLGTAGTQSGDKVRDAFDKVNQNFSGFMDAFDKVNQNFSGFMLSNTSGYYLAYSETAISVTSTTLSYTDTIFSAPKGTYLIFLSANLVSVTANSDIVYLGLYDSSNNPLGIDMVSHNTRAGESDWRTSMGRVVFANSIPIKLGYKLNAKTTNGTITKYYVLFLRIA